MMERNKHINVCLVQKSQIPKEEKVQLKWKQSGHRHSCKARKGLSGRRSKRKRYAACDYMKHHLKHVPRHDVQD